jgi:hypothetical protein
MYVLVLFASFLALTLLLAFELLIKYVNLLLLLLLLLYFFERNYLSADFVCAKFMGHNFKVSHRRHVDNCRFIRGDKAAGA